MNWQTTINNVFSGFILLKRCYDKTLEPLMKESGLSKIELDILLFLSNHPNLNTATDISTRKMITKSHVSTALRHLESIGFIRRYYDLNNRKTIYISLEPASFPTVHQGTLLQKKFSRTLLEGISEEDQTLMRSVLERVFDNARTFIQEPDNAKEDAGSFPPRF